ncbi:MAG: efflux RND transporter periplasmic adaptor subunit [Planctomycetota bacterium]
MKKLILLGVLAAAAAVGLIWWRSGRREEPGGPAKPATTEATRGPIRAIVATSGRVVPNLEVEIKCKASGEVIRLPFDVSDAVKKGDLLVQLDPVDEERSVKRAEVSLAVSRARLAQAKVKLLTAVRDLATERSRAGAALKSSSARHEDAKAKFWRADELKKKKLASVEEFETARAAEAAAAAELAAAKARVEDLKTLELALETRRQDIKIAEAQVTADELSLSDARQRLADTKVIAPMSGVVSARNVQTGQIISSGISNVGGGTAVLTLADLSRVFVLASVDESDIGRVPVGPRATITADAFKERHFFGEVVQVATRGKSVSNVVTFEVKIEVRGRSRGLLKPEMTANVEIVAGEREDAVLVPVQAVARRRGERYVTVRLPGGKTEERSVKVGISDGERMEISEGLKEGETVLLRKGDESSRWRTNEDEARDRRRAMRIRARTMGGRHRR